MASMGQVLMEQVPEGSLSVPESPEVKRAEAIATGNAEDRYIFRRLRIGILVGILVTVPFTCGVVAVSLLLVDSFALGTVLVGVWGGVLGGAFLGGIAALPNLESTTAAGGVTAQPESIGRRQLVA
jgi:hypothetical protein